MRIPFARTLRQFRQKGFAKTFSMMLVLSLRRINVYVHPLPSASVVEVNKSRMLLHPKNGGIDQDLFLYRKREPICTEYLMRSVVLNEGDVVLDIGANIGYYVLVESRLVGESGRVYAVEPVAQNFDVLLKNVRLNNLKNVSEFRFAFGEEEARSSIYISDKSNLCSMIKDSVGGSVVGEEEVPVTSVDAFFNDRMPPNFIRMDVEGYEYHIFRGMQKILAGDVKILVELHPWPPYMAPQKLQELLDILEHNGFRVRFAVFEDKVEENKIIRTLMKKAGNKLPLISLSMSIREFRQWLDENPRLASPNVIFDKCPA